MGRGTCHGRQVNALRVRGHNCCGVTQDLIINIGLRNRVIALTEKLFLGGQSLPTRYDSARRIRPKMARQRRDKRIGYQHIAKGLIAVIGG